jgi:Holliday junction resolvasome RuvABC endonuclease subunit
VIDLKTCLPIAAELVLSSKEKKQRILAAEDGGRRGLAIHRMVRRLFREHHIVVVAQEANLGSKSFHAATGLARAQQACIDAIDDELGSMPILVTPQQVKKSAAGSNSASKEEVERAMIARWAPVRFDILLAKFIGSEWENVYDASAVAHCVWDFPAVSSIRKLLL